MPLFIHLVKQESHRAGVGNHEADGAAQTVVMEREPEWRVPEGKAHLHMTHIPPRAEEEERSRLVWRRTGAEENYECTRSKCTCWRR